MERGSEHRQGNPDGHSPADLAPCTKGTGLDIFAMMEPAKQVGATSMRCSRVDDDHVVVVVGDVSGKGFPPRSSWPSP